MFLFVRIAGGFFFWEQPSQEELHIDITTRWLETFSRGRRIISRSHWSHPTSLYNDDRWLQGSLKLLSSRLPSNHMQIRLRLWYLFVSDWNEVLVLCLLFSQWHNSHQVIDALDPARTIVSHRLYRQHCTDSAKIQPAGPWLRDEYCRTFACTRRSLHNFFKNDIFFHLNILKGWNMLKLPLRHQSSCRSFRVRTSKSSACWEGPWARCLGEALATSLGKP